LIEGEALTVQVIDGGVGIDPERLRTLGVDKVVSSKVGGSGIGLMMAKGELRSRGGDLNIASQLGQGTTVSLVLRRHS